MRGKIAVTTLVMSTLLVTGAWIDPRSNDEDGSAAASCNFEIQARNSSSHNVYLDLYTSKVKRTSGIGGSWKDLRMQNARVGPGVTISPQKVTVSAKCSATRKWIINFREGSSGGFQRNTKYTYKDTRVSSSSGRRVLNLGDVGKW